MSPFSLPPLAWKKQLQPSAAKGRPDSDSSPCAGGHVITESHFPSKRREMTMNDRQLLLRPTD